MSEFQISNPRVFWVVGGVSGIVGLAHIGEIIILLLTDIVAPKGYLTSFVISVLITLGLLYGVYWVNQSELSQQRDDRIVGWFLAGLIGFLLMNVGFMVATPVETRFALVTWFLWAVTFGGGVGFVIGVFETRAIVREVEAEQIRMRQQELKQERDRLEQFASTISHDLRNPLNIAMGRLELANEEVESEHLQKVETALNRIEDLIEDILTLARTGNDIDVRQSVDIGTLAQSSWEGVETGTATLEIEVDRTFQADRSRLRQVLENLIRNAIEHGGEDVTVTIGELDDGFFVEDDGPGIPDDEREDVFDMSYSTSESGTGLGLKIVKEIILAHGWNIEVKEGTDGGARFEITNVPFGKG